jgi:hypothetical protein
VGEVKVGDTDPKTELNSTITQLKIKRGGRLTIPANTTLKVRDAHLATNPRVGTIVGDLTGGGADPVIEVGAVGKFDVFAIVGSNEDSNFYVAGSAAEQDPTVPASSVYIYTWKAASGGSARWERPTTDGLVSGLGGADNGKAQAVIRGLCAAEVERAERRP